MVDGRDNAWRTRAPGPHARGNTARQATDGLWTEARGQQKQSNDPGNNQHNLTTPIIGRRYRANGTSRHIQHSPSTPTTGLRERGNDTRRSTSRSGRQNAATQRNMRREERVTVQGPVKEQRPDRMSHGGGGGGEGTVDLNAPAPLQSQKFVLHFRGHPQPHSRIKGASNNCCFVLLELRRAGGGRQGCRCIHSGLPRATDETTF